jgi:hypothetical protein
VSVSSPDAMCGMFSDNIDIAFEIGNAGDLRVGPGVLVHFFGTWDNAEEALKDGMGNTLERELTQSLEPGRSVVMSVNFKQQSNSRGSLPAKVRVLVDPSSNQSPSGGERECHEDNNDLSADVNPGNLRADLAVDLGTVMVMCPTAKVDATVRNLGSAEAAASLVRFYAGDPAQGGTLLHEEMLSGPLAAGADTTFSAMLGTLPGRGAVTIFAIVDPERQIEECNEANNRDSAPANFNCGISPD